MKEYLTLYIIRELHFKTLWYQYNLYEWQKSKALTAQNAIEDVEKQNSDSLLGETQSCTASAENILAVSYKIKYILSIWSINYTLWNLPKWVEKLCWHKNSYMDVYSSFIYNCRNWKQPRCPSVGEWVNSGLSRQWSIIQC